MPQITNLTDRPRHVRIANGRNGEERYEILQPGESKNIEPLSRASLVGEELAGALLVKDAAGRETAEAVSETHTVGAMPPASHTKATPTALDHKKR